jgi:hypothetical protein
MEDLWLGVSREDKAVRSLAHGIAADWKWATGKSMPRIHDHRDTRKLWRHCSRARAHPLWFIIDALRFDVGHEAAGTLVDCALGKELPAAMNDIEDRRAKLVK